jgi:antibiotic biosynthesis monooxygenase (ABM) superfamily enzyme
VTTATASFKSSPSAEAQVPSPTSARPASPAPRPSKVRLATLMVIAVYPVITLYLYVLMPLTDGWALWQRTLILVPMMVLTIVFLVMPNLQKHLGWFIARLPRPTRAPRQG